MKRALIFLAILALAAACTPPPATLIEPQTAAAMTWEAIPRTATPLPQKATATSTLAPAASNLQLASGPGSQCIPAVTERARALVTRVIDGETIEVVISNDMFHVRYIGIDAPGIVPSIEWQGPQAISANDRLVSGQFVTLVKDVSEADPNGFLLRYVFYNDIFVNYELVHQGHARAVSMPPDTACDTVLQLAQAEAQVSSLGVWMPTPIPTATITPTPTITAIPSPTKTPPCDCKVRPKLTCNNFATQTQAQACFDYCQLMGFGDVFNMDKNANGKACEGLGG